VLVFILYVLVFILDVLVGQLAKLIVARLYNYALYYKNCNSMEEQLHLLRKNIKVIKHEHPFC